MARGLKKGMTNNPDGSPTKSEKGSSKVRIGCRLSPTSGDMFEELKEMGISQTDIVNKGIELYYHQVKTAK